MLRLTALDLLGSRHLMLGFRDTYMRVQGQLALIGMGPCFHMPAVACVHDGARTQVTWVSSVHLLYLLTGNVYDAASHLIRKPALYVDVCAI